MPTFPLQSVLSDDHLRAFGLIIAQWASLEALLGVALREICHLESEGGILVTTGMDYRVVTGMLQTAVRRRFPKEDADFFDKLMVKLGKLKDARDIIAHKRWEPGEKPGFIAPIGLKTLGTLKILTGEVNLDGLTQVAEKILMGGRMLLSFFQERGLLQNLPPQ